MEVINEKLLLSFGLLSACTAPTVPGFTAVGYFVSSLISTPTHKCACADPEKTRVYCKDNDKGDIIVAPISEATHLCCGACMTKCEEVK